MIPLNDEQRFIRYIADLIWPALACQADYQLRGQLLLHVENPLQRVLVTSISNTIRGQLWDRTDEETADVN